MASKNLYVTSIQRSIIPRVTKRMAHYYVDNTTVMNSSHELAKNNILIKKKWVQKIVVITFNTQV